MVSLISDAGECVVERILLEPLVEWLNAESELNLEWLLLTVEAVVGGVWGGELG